MIGPLEDASQIPSRSHIRASSARHPLTSPIRLSRARLALLAVPSACAPACAPVRSRPPPVPCSKMELADLCGSMRPSVRPDQCRLVILQPRGGALFSIYESMRRALLACVLTLDKHSTSPPDGAEASAKSPHTSSARTAPPVARSRAYRRTTTSGVHDVDSVGLVAPQTRAWQVFSSPRCALRSLSHD